MKASRSLILLLILTIVVILCAGCTSTSQPAAIVTTVPTDTVAAPTIVPTLATCGVENCHGFTVTCGSNPATACTNEMDAGDRCRQYASCQIVSGSCQLVTESKYDKCANCVKQCQNAYYNNPNQLMDCSQNC
jgi:hypothetical protein